MRDREVVNRFCAFALLGNEALQGSIDEFLAEGLKKMNPFAADKPEELDQLHQQFRRSLENNIHVFGKHAFRKHDVDLSDQKRKPFNVALFDVFSVLLAGYSQDSVKDHAAAIRAGFARLMDDDEFFTAISNATSSRERVRTRFEKARAMLSEVFDAD